MVLLLFHICPCWTTCMGSILLSTKSPFLGIDGLKFMARGITFRNTAGAQKGQAVALRSASDLSVFYQCSIQGYQDTLFVLSQRQFYKQCYIYGTIDFIFGNAAVVFQSCMVYARLPVHGQANIITAQGRNDPYQNTGISLHSCRILAAPDLLPSISSVETYLGRPWMPYSRTVYLKSYLGALVAPLGWSTWDGSNYALNTLYYGEYKNFGPGASTAKRVKWKGYHVITNASEASRFTVGTFIAGKAWLPATSVPFTAGLWSYVNIKEFNLFTRFFQWIIIYLHLLFIQLHRAQWNLGFIGKCRSHYWAQS